MASVFQQFGGIRPMAAKLGVPPSTIKSWHAQRRIPAWRHAAILAAASGLGLTLTESDLTEIQPDESAVEDAA
jgi:DNA-binding transcriptional regulator YdaS (Cro superfamily)